MEQSVAVVLRLLQSCSNERSRLFFSYFLCAVFALFDVGTIFILFKVLQSLQGYFSGIEAQIDIISGVVRVDVIAGIYLIMALSGLKLVLGMFVTWFRANAVFKCQEELQYLFLGEMSALQNTASSFQRSELDEKEAVSVVTIDTGLFNSAAYALGTLIIDVLAVLALVIFLALTVTIQVITVISTLLILVYVTFRGLRGYQKKWAATRLQAETARVASVVEVYRLNLEFPWGVPQVCRRSFRRLLEEIRGSGSKQALLQLFPRLYIEFIFLGALGLFAIFFSSPSSLSDYSDSIVALGLAGFRALPSISKVFSSFNSLRNAQAGCERLLARLNNEKPSMLNHVSEIVSRYPQLSKMKSHFDSHANVILGLSGRSGTGKSTFLRVLHLYALNANRVSCYLPSNPVLISGSLLENIFPAGDDSGAIMNSQLVQRILFTSERLNSKSLNVEVYENGRNFSSGERQRIAISRAVNASSDLIILDENLSNVDLDGAKSIIESFRNFRTKGMLIVVSHNKTLLDSCDDVIEI